VSRRSKYRPLVRRARRRDSSLLAVPGGPSSSRCSPASAARIIRRTCARRRRARSAARANGFEALAFRHSRVARLRLTLQQALLHVAHGGEHPLLQLAAGPRVSDLCGSRGACRPAQRTGWGPAAAPWALRKPECPAESGDALRRRMSVCVSSTCCVSRDMSSSVSWLSEGAAWSARTAFATSRLCRLHPLALGAGRARNAGVDASVLAWAGHAAPRHSTSSRCGRTAAGGALLGSTLDRIAAGVARTERPACLSCVNRPALALSTLVFFSCKQKSYPQ